MYILLFFLALGLAFLETTFLPAFAVYGGFVSIITVVLVLIILLGDRKQASAFLLFSTIFVSIFSKIPLIYFLLPNFLVLVLLDFLISRRIIVRPGALLSLMLFFAAVFLSEFTRLLLINAFSLSNLFSVIIASAYSAFIGGLIYYLFNKIYLYFNPHILHERVKIQRIN